MLPQMAFPSTYTQVLHPKFFFFFLGLIRAVAQILLRLMGLAHISETDFSWPEPGSCIPASVLQDLLPVIKFTEAGGKGKGFGSKERCAVCQYEYEDGEEIRRLSSCGHIFHRRCVDKWVKYDRRTCPLCRSLFIPDHIAESFSDLIEFGGEFAFINSFL